MKALLAAVFCAGCILACGNAETSGFSLPIDFDPSQITFALQFLQQEALKEDMLKPVPEKSLKHIISSYEAILPTAKALLSRTQNIQLRNTLSEVLDASEIIYGKLKSGSPADIAELKEYLSEKRSTVAGNLGRLILATVNVLGDLSTNKHAISLYGA